MNLVMYLFNFQLTQKGSQVIITVKVGLCVADRQIQKSLCDINAILIVSLCFQIIFIICFISVVLLLWGHAVA
jgi:hypothetical protein